MRQFADEADRVREQNILVRRQFQPPRRRVERGEQNVLRQNVRAGQRVEQRGFSGVRVTDNRSERPLAALTPGAFRRARETVMVLTPANFATSCILALRGFKCTVLRAD